jgi:hypothetical protein
MGKKLRIAILLAILLVVAADSWYDQHRAHEWRRTLTVGVFPLAGDDSPVTRAYIAGLTHAEFAAIEEFFAAEAKRYGLSDSEPLRIALERSPASLPPPPPTAGGPLGGIWWSLTLRYYAWRFGVASDGTRPPIRMFVIYHDPRISPRVPHSAGLDKGLIGVANVFALARMAGSNDVVITHELLHTLGATDKYDPANDLPRFPEGYGDPAQLPRYPQLVAEIMAGRRALSPTAAEIPASLDFCLIGSATANEIQWTRH